MPAAMSGSGSLAKTGAGTLILSGTNSYGGGTTVSAGILQGNTASLQGNITQQCVAWCSTRPAAASMPAPCRAPAA